MAVDLARYVVALEAQSAQYIAELQKANNKLDEFHGIQTRIIGDIKNMFVGLASIAGARMFVNFVDSTIDAADQMLKMSQKVGIGIETLQALKLAASMADLDIGSLQSSLMRLSRSVVEASRNAGSPAAQAFKQLGVSVRDSNDQLLSVEQVLRAVADRYAQMADGTTKTANAQAIFSRGGAQMIAMLNQGSKGIDEMMDALRSLGAMWSEDSAKAASHFNDNLKLMHVAMQGIGSAIAQGMLPALNDATDAMVAFAKDGQSAAIVGEALGVVMKGLALTALTFGDGIVRLGVRLGGLAAAMAILARPESIFKNWSEASSVLGETQADLDRMQARSDEVMDKLLHGGDAATQTLRNLQAALRGTGTASEEAAAGTQQFAAAIAAVNARAKQWMDDERTINKAYDDQKEANDQIVLGLQMQAATFGMSSDEIAIFTLQLHDATAEQIAAARAAADLKAAQEDEMRKRSPAYANAMFAQGYGQLEGATKIHEANQQIVDSLTLEAATWGKTREQVALYKLEVGGATEEQKKAARDAIANMKGLSDEALKNFGAAMGRGIHDTMIDALMGVETSFSDMLKRMAAELLVSEFFQMMQKQWPTSDSGGGVWGDIVGAFAGMMGGAKGMSGGGPVTGGSLYRVHPGEAFFTPDMSGVVGKAGGGMGTTYFEQHVHFDVGLETVDDRIRRAAGPISAATMAAITKAQSRPSIA